MRVAQQFNSMYDRCFQYGQCCVRLSSIGCSFWELTVSLLAPKTMELLPPGGTRIMPAAFSQSNCASTTGARELQVQGSQRLAHLPKANQISSIARDVQGVVIQAGRVPSRAWPCMARHLAAGQENFRQHSY